MSLFANADHLYAVLSTLFSRINETNPGAVNIAATSGVIYRLRFSEPTAEMTINTRHNPVEINYGASSLRADIEVSLSADTFHQILLGEMGLKKAWSSGLVKLRGTFWKAIALEEIFRLGQRLYPGVLQEQAGSAESII